MGFLFLLVPWVRVPEPEKGMDDETLEHFSPGQVPKEDVEKQLSGKLFTMDSSNASHSPQGMKHWMVMPTENNAEIQDAPFHKSWENHRNKINWKPFQMLTQNDALLYFITEVTVPPIRTTLKTGGILKIDAVSQVAVVT